MPQTRPLPRPDDPVAPAPPGTLPKTDQPTRRCPPGRCARVDAAPMAEIVSRCAAREILEERAGILADAALRLARCYGTTPEPRLDRQQTWELRRAGMEVGPGIAERVTPRRSAA